MFKSFFPQPRLFFASVILWTAVTMALWYSGAHNWGQYIGLGVPKPEDSEIVGIHYFWSPSFLWLYVYYLIAVAAFAAFWFTWSPHRWQVWSILGSAVILFTTYFGVQISVALNNWRRPFFDQVQSALGDNSTVTAASLYDLIIVFASIAFMSIFVFVATRFLVSHWIFRWRTAMNDYYMARWTKLRHIEGASQRVQEDTMRFAGIMEGLGVSIVDAVMTLIAFLPPALVTVELRDRIAHRRCNSCAAVHRCDLLVDLRDGAACRCRDQIARPGIPEPARRGGLPQGTRLWRG